MLITRPVTFKQKFIHFFKKKKKIRNDDDAMTQVETREKPAATLTLDI